MARKLLVLGTFLVLFLNGCSTPLELVLKHTPQPGVSQIKEATNVTVNVQVKDISQNKGNVCGHLADPPGKNIPILATEVIAVTFRNAIEQELMNRGFSLGLDYSVLISADITRFYYYHTLSELQAIIPNPQVADFTMIVVVRSKKGERLYSRQIEAQVIEHESFLTREKVQSALNQVLDQGMRYLFEDQSFLAALLAVGN